MVLIATLMVIPASGARSTSATVAAGGHIAQDLRPTDERLERLVDAALAADPLTESYEIIVTVVDAKATLHGAVDSDDERARAGSVAADVEGIEEVDNELTVDRSLLSPDRSDGEIWQEIRDQLAKEIPEEEEAIDTSVENALVIFTGTVSSRDLRRRATEIAFRAGALLVKNELRVVD